MDTALTNVLPYLKYYAGMSGTLYELYCANLLKQAGWDVQWLGERAGSYADLLATRANIVCALECKRYETKIGVDAVRQITASRFLNHDITHTVVVASSGFTESARCMAQKSNTLLLGHSELPELFEELSPPAPPNTQLDVIYIPFAWLETLPNRAHKLFAGKGNSEDVPRVCAAVIAAAHHDAAKHPKLSGTLWGTASGNRLCTIAGFNPKNTRHRRRVQSARLILECTALLTDHHGRTRAFLEPTKYDKFAAIERVSFSKHHTFKSWSIDEDVWQSLNMHDARCFVLDRRAFVLNERSSLAFNLYWALSASISKHQNHRNGILPTQPDGICSVNLRTLYEAGGLSGMYRRTDKLAKVFESALGSMIREGLLNSYQLPNFQGLGIEAYLNKHLSLSFDAPIQTKSSR